MNAAGHAKSKASKRIIMDAMKSLMFRQPFNIITVSKICSTATISRNTFYRIFSSKEEVASVLLGEMVNESIIGSFCFDENCEFS